MNIAVCYVYPTPHVPLSEYERPGEREEYALRFVASYLSAPPGVEHKLIFIANGGPPTRFMRSMAACCGDVEWFVHDDSGWDIGAYIAISRNIESDLLFCMGGTSYVMRQGWLKRVSEAWNKYGYGVYGTLASYEITPHFCTTGFGVHPSELREYPYKVQTKGERYAFEHGERSMVQLMMARKLPAVMVTWSGEYLCPDWRKPRNVYAKGDQSECLVYFKHSDTYRFGDSREKTRRTALADNFTHEPSKCLCMRNVLVKTSTLA